MIKCDYYEILGIGKNASAKAVRQIDLAAQICYHISTAPRVGLGLSGVFL